MAIELNRWPYGLELQPSANGLFHSQEAGQFDAVVGNPPFIRYQYLPEEQQFLAARKNCPLQTPPMELQFCQDENGRSNN